MVQAVRPHIHINGNGKQYPLTVVPDAQDRAGAKRKVHLLSSITYSHGEGWVWFVFVGVCVCEFVLERFVFWVALHPEEVDLFVGLSWFEIWSSLKLRQVMSPTFTT